MPSVTIYASDAHARRRAQRGACSHRSFRWLAAVTAQSFPRMRSAQKVRSGRAGYLPEHGAGEYLRSSPAWGRIADLRERELSACLAVWAGPLAMVTCASVARENCGITVRTSSTRWWIRSNYRTCRCEYVPRSRSPFPVASGHDQLLALLCT
jgi:hypothetical protein